MRRHIRFLIALSLVALGAAAFAVIFRHALALWYHVAFRSDDVVSAISRLPWWMRLSLPVLGGATAGLISRLRASPGQSMSNVMEAVVLGRVQLSMRTTLSRALASWTAIATGMSIGREGPLIEFGGALGAAIGRILGLAVDHARVLVAAGTAAGFAAAYNTPFAAILFVFETIVGIAVPGALLATMAATVLATTLTRAVIGTEPIYGQRSFVLASPMDMCWLALLGALASMAAYGFKGVLASFEEWFDRHPIPQPLRAMLGGTLVGSLAVWLPEVSGNGYEPLNGILDQRIGLATLGVLMLAKVVATSGSVASGVPGGVFTPMLLVGAALGTLWSHFLSVLTSSAVDPGSYALVGMAATTAASIHSPLTAAVLVFELSGDYAIVLPLLLATTVSTALSRSLGSKSVYESELNRRGLTMALTFEGRQIEVK